MKEWDLSIGFYPGILIGMRTYNNNQGVSHVFYLPLIDLCINIYNERTDINRDEE
jgi:hypothetical protein